MATRVLHVLPSNQRRGAETTAFLLHERLRSLGWDSATVSLIEAVFGNRLPVTALGRHRYSPTVLLALRRRANAADVVVAHGSSALAACAAALTWTGVPFVYTNIGDPRFWADTPGKRRRVRSFLRRAAAVAAISPTSRQVLIEEFGVPAHKVSVIPNARSGRDFRPVDAAGRDAARRALGVPEDGPMVLAVGALGPEKRLDVAVSAVAQMPDAVLVIVGDGPERPRLQVLADRLAPGRVVLLGSLSQPAQAYAAADCLLLTSDSEGVPGVIIEAGLAGLPVIATDVGFVRDVVVDGVTGRLVPVPEPTLVAGAVRDVLKRSTELGAAAREHCLAHFEAGIVVERWMDLLGSVTAGRARRTGH